jgi:hypothetical protein
VNIVKEKTEEKNEKEPAVKVITPEERKRLLIEGIKKTIVPAFIGTIFAVIFVLTGDKIAGKPWLAVLMLVVLVSYYVQRLLYPSLGVRAKEFEVKDWLYVEFLTIIFMIVTWTLLLNIGTLNVTVNPSTMNLGVPVNVTANVTSDGISIEGAIVYLNGTGVNMNSTTGKDNKAYFYNVNPSSVENITITARKEGYASGHTNITIRVK